MNADLYFAVGLFLLLFFGTAVLSQWRRIPGVLWEHPLLFALAFVGVTGVIFFFGAIELVGRYGMGGLIGIFAFAGTFILSPLFLEPIRWISRRHALATLPDLLVFRFRSPAVAIVSSLLMAISCLPLVAAQFSLITSLLPPELAAGQVPRILVMTLFTLGAIIFIYAFGKPERATRAVPGVAALAAILAIGVLLASGVLAVHQVFGDIDSLNQWAESSNQDQIVMRFENAYALILLFFPLALILPQQSFLLTFSNWWPRLSPSGWILPLLILLMTLPVFPVLWAGLKLQLDTPLQLYYLALPAALDAHWLAKLTLVAMLMVSLSLITVTALAVGKLLVTSCLISPGKRFAGRDLDLWINNRRFAMAALWLVGALLFSLYNRSNSVADLTIAAMIGLSQLLPGVIATLFIPNINRKGVLAGMAVGCSFWIYGVVAPIFFGVEPPAILGRAIATGPENWPFWLLESLVANLLVALLVSLTTRTSQEEEHYAYQCMVDNLPAPQRQSLAIKPFAAIEEDLQDWIGAPAASRELQQAVTALAIREDDLRPITMRALRDQLCYQLSAKLGTLTADHVIARVMPSGSGPLVDDISYLESQLANAGNALSGLAAELNKLRLYHRQTLENLPVGVCSLDPEGEVLLWNNTIARYTGVSQIAAEGANLAAFPPPWGDILSAFRDAPEESCQNREVRGDRENRWFHFSKHYIANHSPYYANYQVILVEDITEHIQLVRELSHAERLTSVGRLAAGVAHEIGNPVTGISCLAQDMVTEATDEETVENARTILGLTERITTIVSTLIDFSRRNRDLELRNVPLRLAVDAAIRLLQLNKEAKVVEFRSAIPEDLMVKADQHQLTQVFVNLFTNARDASAAGDLVEISARATADKVVVQVTDQGTGIPLENVNRVMDPFFTTKEPGEGTGLGLSLVYSIIRTHGGTVNIHSPVAGNRGTRVTLTLDKATPSR